MNLGVRISFAADNDFCFLLFGRTRIKDTADRARRTTRLATTGHSAWICLYLAISRAHTAISRTDQAATGKTPSQTSCPAKISSITFLDLFLVTITASIARARIKSLTIEGAAQVPRLERIAKIIIEHGTSATADIWRNIVSL
jgi:hypothetical protein